jgi:CubicO group peptidase (beta-lactamase class C family)
MSYKVSLICLKSSLAAVFMLFLQVANAQYNWTELESKLKDNQKVLGIDAVALVWKGDSLIYKKEMGKFDGKTQAPIASCSKWLTTALVMQFVDEGKLSLDDKVIKYLPEFDKYFKGYITIRQCLSHMTGIEDEGGLLKKMIQRKRFPSLADEVSSFAAKNIRANPGNDFWYGSIGLNIAGRILEVISKKKFDQLIKQKLFNPLGMRKTSFSNLDNSAVNPSGGAVSTADDYLKFLVMLLNKGKYNGTQILSGASVNQMMKTQNKLSQVKYAPVAAGGYTYALGSWVVEEKNGTANSLTCPGLFGTWPVVDYCRGYVSIVFVKDFLNEDVSQVQRQIKTIIDKQVVSICK